MGLKGAPACHHYFLNYARFLLFNIIMQDEKSKTRYGDEELAEFRRLIIQKIKIARAELQTMASALSNDLEDRSEVAAGKTLEDGSATLEKESLNQLAGRQKKFIGQLEAALVRIENKTYGICRETGKLIPKERLRAVPHTTLSIEAKQKSA